MTTRTRLFQSLRFVLECFGIALVLAGIWRWLGLPRGVWAAWLIAALAMLGAWGFQWVLERHFGRISREILRQYEAEQTGACAAARVMCEHDGYVLERSTEDENTVYITLPDGLRLVFREGEYVGWYVCGVREADDGLI